jgi:putative ABC transport system permease protein
MAWVDSPLIYRPVNQNPPSVLNLIARVDIRQAAVASAIQRKIAAIDPDIPVEEIETVREVEAKTLAYPRFRAILLTTLAGLALLLSTIGLYGVLSHLVTQRTHEIGVRMALGGQRNEVVFLVLKEGLSLTIMGVALGICVALALSRYFRALLYGISDTDPLLLTGVSLILPLAALAAAYVPARRATAVDPMVALRYE